ncbi:hypothetical protein D3C79_814750 [compost metagenome]
MFHPVQRLPPAPDPAQQYRSLDAGTRQPDQQQHPDLVAKPHAAPAVAVPAGCRRWRQQGQPDPQPEPAGVRQQLSADLFRRPGRLHAIGTAGQSRRRLRSAGSRLVQGRYQCRPVHRHRAVHFRFGQQTGHHPRHPGTAPGPADRRQWRRHRPGQHQCDHQRTELRRPRPGLHRQRRRQDPRAPASRPGAEKPQRRLPARHSAGGQRPERSRTGRPQAVHHLHQGQRRALG